MTQAYGYSRAIRDATVQDGQGRTIRSKIPYPGLAEPHSQLGLPIVRGQDLLGVLFVESALDRAIVPLLPQQRMRAGRKPAVEGVPISWQALCLY